MNVIDEIVSVTHSSLRMVPKSCTEISISILFQELFEKSNDPEIIAQCPDIRWHFIGTCQSNKAAKLVKSKNLAFVETIASEKLADKLQSACKAQGKLVKVMVQVSK